MEQGGNHFWQFGSNHLQCGVSGQRRGTGMTWFEDLTGITETGAEHVRSQLEQDGEWLRSRANGSAWKPGRLEIPSLADLRRQLASIDSASAGPLRISECVADVRQLHADPANANALFQVASQFNLLEMISPSVVPEHGIGNYQYDRTQGPICAIACGAGTIHRNYLVEVDGQPGQSEHRQIDCLTDLGEALGNQDNRLWKMQNGYALASEQGLQHVAEQLADQDETARDQLRQRLRIGLQWQTEVTLPRAGHLVSQGYCSALPVAYSHHSADQWTPFACLVLEACYDAVFCAARLNKARTGNDQLFLTLIGGGVFGNRTKWISDAIERACAIHRDSGLDVQIVSYGRSQPIVNELIKRAGRQ